MLRIAVDDTDSRQGGCTTHLAHLIRDEFRECHAPEPPRLVRLNPNVPWKTRGNAAIAIILDAPRRLRPEDALARVAVIVRDHAQLADAGTEPGIAVSEHPVEKGFYTRVLREIVPREDALRALDDAGAAVKGFQGGRGLIGCAGALAWDPYARDHTFERVAYRARERWGTARAIDPETVRKVAGVPGTFDSYDFVEDEVVMVPRSPCPVLWGLRGEEAETLTAGDGILGPEASTHGTLFITNQATDDHLTPATGATAVDGGNHVIEAVVEDAPTRIEGGHVFVGIRSEGVATRLAAFEPTRSFRDVLRALVPGDKVTAAGAVRAGPDGVLTVNVEKMCVRDLAVRPASGPNPLCPACGKAMRSAGRDAPYRCRPCGTRTPKDRAVGTGAAAIGLGWVEVPARARRHLAKPLARGIIKEWENGR